MNLPYILQVQICIALLWVVYRLFMRQSGAFAQNRLYLLGAMLLAFVIPALSIPVYPAATPGGTPVIEVGEALMGAVVLPETGWSWREVMGTIYAIGTLILFTGMLVQTLRLLRTLRHSRATRYEKTRIVSSPTIRSPFSFFRYIFVNDKQMKEKEFPQIVAHELCHVRLGHSIDSVFAQILLILLWWNPFVWLWNRSLKEVHEFQADQAVLHQGFDSKQYIILLISALADTHPEFVSGFSYSLIKNRLLMMTKEKNRFSRLSILTALPVLAALILIFSCTTKTLQAQAPPPAASQNSSGTLSEQDERNAPFLTVEKMPQFEGGDLETFRRWVMEQLSYPLEAQQQKIQGKVIIQFIVSRDGTLSDLDITSSPSPLLSEEILRIFRLSPKWTPGQQRGETVRVQYTIPFDFRLEPSAATAQQSPDEPGMPFLSVETMPQFQNGDINTFQQWVSGRLTYPTAAVERGIQGRVIISFIIERDGTVTHIQAEDSPSPLLTDEAIRVIQSSPQWTPGKQRGHLVRVKYTLPLQFQLPTPAPTPIGGVTVVGYSS